MSSSTEYRDMTVAYTDAELDEFRPLFKSLKTYDPSNDTIGAIDFGEVCRLMRYERTEEQIESYQVFFDKYHQGKISWDFFCSLCKVINEPTAVAVEYASKFDKNGDGYIQETEFEDLLEMIAKHEPKIAKKTFVDFVAEADINQDGKVSIEECAKWMEKYLKE